MNTGHVFLHLKVHMMRVHCPTIFSSVLLTLHCFVWQLRKYKGSEKIRLKAEVIYHKFKGFFLAGDGELNSSVCRPKVGKIQIKVKDHSTFKVQIMCIKKKQNRGCWIKCLLRFNFVLKKNLLHDLSWKKFQYYYLGVTKLILCQFIYVDLLLYGSQSDIVDQVCYLAPNMLDFIIDYGTPS